MTLKTIKNFRGGLTYEAPSAEVIDVMSEGVFCISERDSYSPADWGEGETGWFE